MIMAAGLGTRMQPFSDIFPKALLPVFGSPILQYTVDLFRFEPMKTLVVNGHHKAKMIQDAIPKMDRGDLQIHFSDESNKLLGSAGGMVKALPLFEGKPFYRVNADRLIDFDFQSLAKKHFKLRERHGVVMTLALAVVDSGNYTEIITDTKSELVKGLGKKEKSKPFFTGVAVMEPEAFAGLPSDEPSDFLKSVLNPEIKRNRVGCHIVDLDWIDIDSPEQLFRCHMDLMDRYEDDTLPKGWKYRMYEKNQRLDDGIWVSRALQVEKNPGWEKKVYYFGSNLPEGNLGPNLVSYGPPENENDRSNGIRLKDGWLSFD